MAGKEPLRILAFALCTISFALLSVAIYTDHWREQIQRSQFGMDINSAKSFEGLWNNCWWDSTGQTHCYPQPYSRRTKNNVQLSLPGRFYFYRGLCIIGLLTSFVGLLFLMSGLKCIDIAMRRKIKMQIGAGMNLVAAACVLITFILFKIKEWQIGVGNNFSSSLGKGMYLLIGCLICQVGAVVLAIAGMETADSDDYEDESFQPKPYQQGSIVNQGGSSYI